MAEDKRMTDAEIEKLFEGMFILPYPHSPQKEKGQEATPAPAPAVHRPASTRKVS